MKYPKPIRIMNEKLSIVSGAIILTIGCFSIFEVIMRGFFSAPTKWTADFNQYLLIFAIFLAAGYGFQAQGHVRVDIVTRLLPTFGRRLMAVVAYLFSMAFVLMFTYYTWKIFIRAIETHIYTYAVIQIPRWILLMAMLIGCALMISSVVCILISIFAKDENYL